MKKTILSVFLPLCLIAVMLGGCGGGSGSSDPADPAEPPEGVVKLTAIARVNSVYYQITTLFIEYGDTVAAPGAHAYSVIDYAVAEAREDYDRREFTEAPVSAVYTNNVPEVRADKTSVNGKYVVVELEPTSYCVPEPTEDGGVIYKPNHNAGMCTWRRRDKDEPGWVSEVCEWFRDDFSQYVVTQKTDVRNAKGDVVAPAGKLPALAVENIYTPERERFEDKVIENFDGRNNSIYYTLYLPKNYDASRKYPLVFNSTGNGGRLNYLQTDAEGNFVNIGAAVVRDRVAVAFTEYREDAIVTTIQTWRNQPDEWQYSDVDAALYLLEYMKENYAVDEERVYAVGSSYGTMLVSQMLNENPNAFTAYAQYNGCWSGSSGWLATYEDGRESFSEENEESAREKLELRRLADLTEAKNFMRPVANAKLAMWVWHAVNDETIGFPSGLAPYEILRELYTEDGLQPAEIDELIRLRVLEDEAYWKVGIAERHACSKMITFYPETIEWLFRQRKGSVE